MTNRLSIYATCLLTIISLPRTSRAAEYLDLAPFATVTSWKDPEAKAFVEHKAVDVIEATPRCIGLVWDEDRDVREIRVRWKGEVDKTPADLRVQYWHRVWPPDPPQMPTIEDPADDHWKGSWLTAATKSDMRDGVTIITFAPLDAKENRKADALPGVTYRRTLKVRLLLPEGCPKPAGLLAYSETVLEPLSLRVEFGAGQQGPGVWAGDVAVFNGTLKSVRPWQFGSGDVFDPPSSWSNVNSVSPKGVLIDLLSARPSPPGSNDATLVTIRAAETVGEARHEHTFTFNTLDLERGPIYVPDMKAYVTRSDAPPFDAKALHAGRTIRQQIPAEPEQSYERASREIPPLDPWERQRGDKVYLPIAADASWQKFAAEYGGDIWIGKRATKAKGAEINRLHWNGETIRYRIGTGEPPYYRDDRKARCSIAENCLPIVINEWEHEGLTYRQEAFATLLEGPLNPSDPARSEQTPAVCLVRLSITNPATDGEPRNAPLWWSIEPGEPLTLQDGVVSDQKSGHVRALLRNDANAAPSLRTVAAKSGEIPAIRTDLRVAPGRTQALDIAIPFVSDVTQEQVTALRRLDWSRERERVARYWREMIDRTTRFTTPEPAFNRLARSVVPHIHISTTKDPKSGLYMVPAAAYGYQVYMNESIFQTQLLDTLGDFDRSTQYLATCTQLQGSRSFPGNYQKPHDAVFHGAKVNDDYDYTASDYGLDHGTVLWGLARHYRFTRDRAWLDQTLPRLLRAIEWIERQRELTRRLDVHGQKPLEYGLLPAGHLEDNSDWGYWFSVNAYCVAGMRETADILRDIQHPDADRISKAADDFHQSMRESVQRSTQRAPVMRKRDGTYAPYVPTRAHQRFRGFGPLRVAYYNRYKTPHLPCYRLSATREVLYGPLILLNLQIFSPQEPIADWILDDWEDNLTLSSSGGFNVHGFTDDALWFSQGGLVFQSNLQNPIWAYLYRDETPAAIRSVYNAFVSCLYPDVAAFTEEYRMWKHGSGPFYKSPDEARFVSRLCDMLVMEAGDELRLGAGVPRRWLTAPEGIRVDRLHTTYGAVAYTIKPGAEPRTLQARITLPPRKPEHGAWLYVRLPDKAKPTSIRINGVEAKGFDPKLERLALTVPAESNGAPTPPGPIEVNISY